MSPGDADPFLAPEAWDDEDARMWAEVLEQDRRPDMPAITMPGEEVSEKHRDVARAQAGEGEEQRDPQAPSRAQDGGARFAQPVDGGRSRQGHGGMEVSSWLEP